MVIAAALLAAVEAAPVPSTTPSRGIFKAEDAVRRKPWTTLAVIAFAALAGAVVFGGGGKSREPHVAGAPSMQPYQATASAVERAIAGAAPAAPAPERVTEADLAPSSKSQRATRPRLATAEPTGQSPSRIGERHRASVPPAMTGATPASRRLH